MAIPTPAGVSTTMTSPAVSTTSDFWLSPIMDPVSPASTSIEHLMDQYLVIAPSTTQQQQQQASPMLQSQPQPSPQLSSSSLHPLRKGIVDTSQCSSSTTSSSQRKARIHYCPYCKHTSNRANNMKEHIQTHDPNRPKNFLCPVCDKRFARKHDMKRHAKSHERHQQKRQA